MRCGARHLVVRTEARAEKAGAREIRGRKRKREKLSAEGTRGGGTGTVPVQDATKWTQDVSSKLRRSTSSQSRCPTKFKQEASQRIVAGPNGGFCIAFCPRLSGWRAFFKRGPTVSKRKVRYRLDRLSIQILPAVGPVPRPAAPLAPQCPPRRAMLTGSVSYKEDLQKINPHDYIKRPTLYVLYMSSRSITVPKSQLLYSSYG